MRSKFPVGEQLDHILRLSSPVEITDLMKKVLIHPLEDFFGRPGKKFRNQVVELGYLLAGQGSQGEISESDKALFSCCADVLESIHAGSLVVDDIQDGSKVRRGQPALHLKYGLPVALNAGNWLYFWPMRKIKNLGLSPERELKLYQLCHDTLLRAHFGQAIDVGIPIDTLPQDRISSVCLASLELKSGALMALAMSLGGAVGGASIERMETLEKFGHAFGIALQMFDDVGNLKAKSENFYDYTKKYEDLILKRPSWLWAVAARSFSEKVFAEFVSAVNHLPDESFLNPWLELHELADLAKRQAQEHLAQCIQDLEFAINNSPRELQALATAKELAERLAKAYD